jgi:hypothetical protein
MCCKRPRRGRASEQAKNWRCRTIARHRQDLDENDPASRSKTPDDAEGINAKQAPPRAPDWRYADDDDGNWMTV